MKEAASLFQVFDGVMVLSVCVRPKSRGTAAYHRRHALRNLAKRMLTCLCCDVPANVASVVRQVRNEQQKRHFYM